MSTAAAAALCLVAAGSAGATEVRVPVVNAAAPEVRIVAPADGARISAGRAVDVRVEARRSDRVGMAVDGRDTWSAPGTLLEGSWTPVPGRHRLVAVAARAGAPDAVDLVEVVVVPVIAPAPGSALAPGSGAAPPVTGTPAPPGVPGASPPSRSPSTPPVAPVAPVAPATPVAPPPSLGPAPGLARGGAPPPALGSAAPSRADAGPAAEEPLWRRVFSHERVAVAVAFPFLLLAAAIAYALLQRFIDGGQKLAWRGRGVADDQVIEF